MKPRRELAPCLAPWAQAFGAQGGSGRPAPILSMNTGTIWATTDRTAHIDRLHQRQKSAVKLQIWHAAHRRRAK
jgi:hypothetical protein